MVRISSRSSDLMPASVFNIRMKKTRLTASATFGTFTDAEPDDEHRRQGHARKTLRMVRNGLLTSAAKGNCMRTMPAAIPATAPMREARQLLAQRHREHEARCCRRGTPRAGTCQIALGWEKKNGSIASPDGPLPQTLGTAQARGAGQPTPRRPAASGATRARLRSPPRVQYAGRWLDWPGRSFRRLSHLQGLPHLFAQACR